MHGLLFFGFDTGFSQSNYLVFDFQSIIVLFVDVGQIVKDDRSQWLFSKLKHPIY